MSPQRTIGDMLGETTSLLCAVAFYGPPVAFLVAPWLLLGLMLIGPFTLILTLVAALLAAVAALALTGALLVTPVVLLRRALTQPQLAPMGNGQLLRDAALDGPDVRHRGRQPVRAARRARAAGA